MDYFILKLKVKITTTTGEIDSINYVCVNSINRAKDTSGKDITSFVSSGVLNVVPTENVISISPSTPPPSWL